MATTRTVTGTMLKPNGAVYTGVSLTFRLIGEILSGTTVVPEYEAEITTSQVDGTFSAALFVPTSGTAQYCVTLPNGDAYYFNLAAGSSVDLSALISIPVVAVDPDYLTELTKFSIKSKAASYAILPGDEIIRCSGTITVTLPAATGSGDAYFVSNTGTGTVTILPTGSDLINGAATLALSRQYIGALFVDVAAATWDGY